MKTRFFLFYYDNDPRRYRETLLSMRRVFSRKLERKSESVRAREGEKEEDGRE